MLPCVCSQIDHRRRKNVVRTSVTQSHTLTLRGCDQLLNRRTLKWNLFVDAIRWREVVTGDVNCLDIISQRDFVFRDTICSGQFLAGEEKSLLLIFSCYVFYFFSCKTLNYTVKEAHTYTFGRKGALEKPYSRHVPLLPPPKKKKCCLF